MDYGIHAVTGQPHGFLVVDYRLLDNDICWFGMFYKPQTIFSYILCTLVALWSIHCFPKSYLRSTSMSSYFGCVSKCCSLHVAVSSCLSYYKIMLKRGFFPLFLRKGSRKLNFLMASWCAYVILYVRQTGPIHCVKIAVTIATYFVSYQLYFS